MINLCHLQDESVSPPRWICVISKMNLYHLQDESVSSPRWICVIYKINLCHLKMNLCQLQDESVSSPRWICVISKMNLCQLQDENVLKIKFFSKIIWYWFPNIFKIFFYFYVQIRAKLNFWNFVQNIDNPGFCFTYPKYISSFI